MARRKIVLLIASMLVPAAAGGALYGAGRTAVDLTMMPVGKLDAGISMPKSANKNILQDTASQNRAGSRQPLVGLMAPNVIGLAAKRRSPMQVLQIFD